MTSGDQFAQINTTLDRLLTLTIDHGKEIGEVKTDLSALRTDVSALRTDFSHVRRALDGIQEAFTEHLGWNLGRQ